MRDGMVHRKRHQAASRSTIGLCEHGSWSGEGASSGCCYRAGVVESGRRGCGDGRLREPELIE
jgi:hypothetical protein